jgi:hypothetical protein
MLRRTDYRLLVGGREERDAQRRRRARLSLRFDGVRRDPVVAVRPPRS